MSVCGIHFATKLNEDGSCDECDDLLRVENERDQLRTEIAELKRLAREVEQQSRKVVYITTTGATHAVKFRKLLDQLRELLKVGE